jgi:tetratricopeptide (TPR) repeat protein
VGVLTLPLWGPVALVGYGGYTAAVSAKNYNDSVVQPAIQSANRSVYDYLNPDALHAKINDYALRLTVNSTNPVFLSKRGELYLLAGNHKDAMADFTAALKSSNDVEPMAHFYSGVIHKALGFYQLAAESYSKAISNFGRDTQYTYAEQMYDGFVNKFEQARRQVKQVNDGAIVAITSFFKVPVRLYDFNLLTFTGLF